MSEKPCNGWTLATLKEHFEVKFKHLEEMRKSEANALVIQAKEYERRLEALNGEQARIAKSQATYVSREVWEAFSLRVEKYMATNAGQRAVLLAGLAILLAIAAAVGSFWK